MMENESKQYIDSLLESVDLRDRSTMNEVMRKALLCCSSDWGATQVYYYIKGKYEKRD